MDVTGSSSSAAILTVDIETGAADRKLTALEKRLRRLGAQGGQTQEPVQIQSLKTRIAELEAQLRTTSRTVDAFNKKRIISSASTAEVGRATQSLRAYGNELQRVGHQSWKASEGQLALHSALRGVGGAMGALWLTYGKYVTVMAAAMSVTKAFKDSIVGGMDADFQAQFVSILQTKGELDLALKNDIRTSLIDISRESIFTVQENAEALKKLSLAGIDASNGLKLLETASNAAIFAQQDMGKTTAQVLDTLNNFGLASDNSLIMERNFGRVADVMAYTAITVNASFTDIAESFKNLTGVAGSFNVTIEESAALLQSLARTGIRGPKAGTYLRNALDDLLGAPISQKAERAFERLQIERYDPSMYGEGDFGVAQYFDNLVAQIRKLSFIDQQDAIRAISNQRSRRVLRQEIIESYKEENSLLERTTRLRQNAEGALTKLASGLTENAQMQMKYAQAAYNSAVTQAFAGNEDLFIDLGRSLQSVFNSENFRDFMSKGVAALANLGNAIVSLIKFITDLREPLEWIGKAILTIGSSLAAIKLTVWVASLGAATTGVVALGKAIVGLTMAHPILAGVAIGFHAMWFAINKFKEMDSVEYKIKSLTEEIQELERSMQPSRISPYMALSKDNDQTRALVEQKKREIAELRGSAEGIEAARREYKAQIERFEADFTRDVSRVSDLVRQKLGPDATVGERLALESRATKAALDDIRKYFDQYAQAVNELKGIEQAGVLSPQGQLELEQSIATWDMLGRVLSDLEERVDAVDRRFASNTISEALRAMSDNSQELQDRLRGMGFELSSVTDLTKLASENWDEQNEALKRSISEMRLGEEGVFAYGQALKELAVEAAQASLSLALLDSVNQSLGVDAMAAAEQKVRQLTAYIVSLQENIRLSSEFRQLERSSRARSGGGGGGRSAGTAEVADVRKVADAEYAEWMSYVNYSKRIVELRRRTAQINEHQYQSALDALSNQTITLGVEREKRVQAEIQRQLARTSDARARERLGSLMDQSLAKERELRLTATFEFEFIKEREAAEVFKMTRDHADTLEELARGHRRVGIELAEVMALERQHNPIKRAGDEAVLQITRQYREELEKVDKLIRDAAGNPSMLAVHLEYRERLIEQMEREKVVARELAELRQEEVRSFQYGWDQAFKEFHDSSTNYAAKAKEAFETFSKGSASAFEQFFMNPTKDGFKGLLQSFLQMLQQMIAKAAAAQLTDMLFGSPGSPTGFASMLGSFASGLFASAKGNAFTPSGPVAAFAKGGTFGPNVVPFARGGAFDRRGEVLTNPTFFKFASGGTFRDGVAGEAGDEGVLPLKRMKDGRLGVHVEGSGDNSVHIHVTVAPGTPHEVKRAAGAGAREAVGLLNRSQRYA